MSEQMERCTGRTSRMLREAIILVLCYKKVAVVFATEYLARDAAKRTRAIALRLGVDKMDAWDNSRIGFFGLHQYKNMREIWEKESVVVMADPGLSDYAELRGASRIGIPLPAEWPT